MSDLMIQPGDMGVLWREKRIGKIQILTRKEFDSYYVFQGEEGTLYEYLDVGDEDWSIFTNALREALEITDGQT